LIQSSRQFLLHPLVDAQPNPLIDVARLDVKVITDYERPTTSFKDTLLPGFKKRSKHAVQSDNSHLHQRIRSLRIWTAGSGAVSALRYQIDAVVRQELAHL